MYAFSKSRMYGLGGNLCQWLKDKVAQVHQRVGDGEARCINDHVAIEQYVNVYGTIDIDILLYGNVVIDTPRLTIPHPLMHLRDFVLEPLAEIAPEAIHPALGKSIHQLAAELGDTGM